VILIMAQSNHGLARHAARSRAATKDQGQELISIALLRQFCASLKKNPSGPPSRHEISEHPGVGSGFQSRGPSVGATFSKRLMKRR